MWAEEEQWEPKQHERHVRHKIPSYAHFIGVAAKAAKAGVAAKARSV